MEDALTFGRAHEVLRYDASTGEFSWRVTLSARRIAGQRAGSNLNGYWRVCVDGRAYRAHRLAWFMAHGSWPVDEIDHINGDKRDNRLSNLRAATHGENSVNRIDPKMAASGHRGVYPGKAGKWVALISEHGVMRYLGVFPSKEEAAEAYQEAAKSDRTQFRVSDLRRAREAAGKK